MEPWVVDPRTLFKVETTKITFHENEYDSDDVPIAIMVENNTLSRVFPAVENITLKENTYLEESSRHKCQKLNIL